MSLTLRGLPTSLPKSVVEWNPSTGQLEPLLPLKANQILDFSYADDAKTIHSIAVQVLPTVKLTGADTALAYNLVGGVPVPAQGHEDGPNYGNGPHGSYCYNTPDGPRPFMLVDDAKNVHQPVANLVASYTAGKDGLNLVSDGAGGNKFQWA